MIVDVFTGKLVRQLDPGVPNAAFPAWSPDGTHIAFSSHDASTQDIYIMPASGGSATRLTDGKGKNDAPAWSPDGKWITFQSDRKDGDGHTEIWIMDPSGNNLMQMTNTARQDWARAPTWSPDGQWIAYISGPHGQDYGEVQIIPASGGDPLRLTDTGGNVFDFRPSWGK
jgi:Tol biopolymer transport system component